MATRPWTADDDDLLTRLHADLVTLTAAARQMERSKATVSRHAARLGLAWDRTQTNAATVAKVKDAAARRADAVLVELELLELAQTQARDGLNGKGWKTLQRGEGGAEHTRELDYVPARDLREHTAARSGMATIIGRLDTTDPAVDAGRSMLEALANTLGVTGPAE